MTDYEAMLSQSEESAKAAEEQTARTREAASRSEEHRVAAIRAKIDDLVMPELQRAKQAFEAAGRYVEIRHRDHGGTAGFPWVEFQVGHSPDPAKLDQKDHAGCYAMFSCPSGKVAGWVSKETSSVYRPNEGEILGGRTDADTLAEGIRRTLDANTLRRARLGYLSR